MFLGHIAKAANDLDRAEKCYRKCISLDDKNQEAMSELRVIANAHARLGSLPMAADDSPARGGGAAVAPRPAGGRGPGPCGLAPDVPPEAGVRPQNRCARRR